MPSSQTGRRGRILNSSSLHDGCLRLPAGRDFLRGVRVRAAVGHHCPHPGPRDGEPEPWWGAVMQGLSSWRGTAMARKGAGGINTPTLSPLSASHLSVLTRSQRVIEARGCSLSGSASQGTQPGREGQRVGGGKDLGEANREEAAPWVKCLR